MWTIVVYSIYFKSTNKHVVKILVKQVEMQKNANTIAASSLAAIAIYQISVISISWKSIKTNSISSNLSSDDVFGSAPDVTRNSSWPTGKSFYSFSCGLLENPAALHEKTRHEGQKLDGLAQVELQHLLIHVLRFDEMEQMQLLKTVLL